MDARVRSNSGLTSRRRSSRIALPAWWHDRARVSFAPNETDDPIGGWDLNRPRRVIILVGAHRRSRERRAANGAVA